MAASRSGARPGRLSLDLFLCGSQHRLHIERRVRQRRAQVVQHFSVVGQEAVVVAGLDEGVCTDQNIQLGGLGGGQHVQRDFLAPVGAGNGGAVDNGVGADALIPTDQRTTHINVVLIGAEASGERVTQEGGVGEPAGIHPAKLRQGGGLCGQRRVGVAGISGLALRADGAPVQRLGVLVPPLSPAPA